MDVMLIWINKSQGMIVATERQQKINNNIKTYPCVGKETNVRKKGDNERG